MQDMWTTHNLYALSSIRDREYNAGEWRGIRHIDKKCLDVLHLDTL